MSKRMLGLVLVTAICTVILGTIGFLVMPPSATTLSKLTPMTSDEKQEPDSKMQVAFQSPGGTMPDDPFFVFDRTVIDFEVGDGDQTFGSQNKVGVSAAVMTAYSNEVDDFMAIGAANAGRVQYLIGIGQPVTKPQSTWLVSIEEAGLVNGQVRVLVMAAAGSDLNYMGQLWTKIDGGVLMELWSLDTIGSSPILLDRTKWWFNGLQTHAESPVTVYQPPAGDPNVPFGPAPTALEMGEIGQPYGSGGGGLQP